MQTEQGKTKCWGKSADASFLPVLLLLLHVLSLPLNKFDQDVDAHETMRFQWLIYELAELLGFLRNLPIDQVAYLDALEVFIFHTEVRWQAQRNFLALWAQRAVLDGTSC